MNFNILVLLLQFIFTQVLASRPTPAINDLFNSPEIPVLKDSDATFWNSTKSRQSNGSPTKRALKLGYLLYNIQMDGRNRGNWQNFLVAGQMLITQGIASSATQNGPNPYEAVILIGSPAANPIAGSLRYASNRYLYKLFSGTYSNTLLDFAFVSNTATSITVSVDTRIVAANPLSQFNARSGLTADVYLIAEGGFKVFPGTTAISGQIGLVGTGYIYPGKVPYNALISGTIVGRGTITI